MKTWDWIFALIWIGMAMAMFFSKHYTEGIAWVLIAGYSVLVSLMNNEIIERQREIRRMHEQNENLQKLRDELMRRINRLVMKNGN